MQLYPLKFKPWFLEKIWGGRKIETVLGKSLPPGRKFGESWELYDFPPGVSPAKDQWLSSEVVNGPLAGRHLHEIVKEFGRDILGDVPLAPQGQFPILIKFLDASEDLSVQVHPDPEYVKNNSGAYLKNEAWYILQADEGATLLKGLRPGVKAESFKKAIKEGNVESLINVVDVKPGQCHYLQSGTVHALKAGILAAEIQTPSDTTFRIYDYDRIEASTGKKRALHIEQAMASIDFSGKSQSVGNFKFESRVAECDNFCIDKFKLTAERERPFKINRPIVWIALRGNALVKVDGDTEATELARGDTMLLPAALKDVTVKATDDFDWLQVTFPIAKS